MCIRDRVKMAASIENASVGGRGLMLVRKLMNEIRYEHSGGCNRLTLVKHLPPPASA